MVEKVNEAKVKLALPKVDEVVDTLKKGAIPDETESPRGVVEWSGDQDSLANAYLAIVAICHQTSPQGEKRMGGTIDGKSLRGWDYLKAKFLQNASRDMSLVEPEVWRTLNSDRLASIFRDDALGLTLGRVNERVALINDLGEKLGSIGTTRIREAFDAADRILAGEKGFLNMLGKTEAYSDPLKKKSFFFSSIAITECGWDPKDKSSMLSPVDYHELRGHLRIGTVEIRDNALRRKLELGIPITADEDLALRSAAQEANNFIATELGIGNSKLHYLLWNIFRACCSRDPGTTHCSTCGSACELPNEYKTMGTYAKQCIFTAVCNSSGKEKKITEPAYLGHFY